MPSNKKFLQSFTPLQTQVSSSDLEQSGGEYAKSLKQKKAVATQELRQPF